MSNIRITYRKSKYLFLSSINFARQIVRDFRRMKTVGCNKRRNEAIIRVALDHPQKCV